MAKSQSALALAPVARRPAQYSWLCRPRRAHLRGARLLCPGRVSLPRYLPALVAHGRTRSGLSLVSLCTWPFGLCGRGAGVALVEGRLGRAGQSTPLLEDWAHGRRGCFCGVHRPAVLPHQRRALSDSRHHPDRGHGALLGTLRHLVFLRPLPAPRDHRRSGTDHRSPAHALGQNYLLG